MAAAEIARLLQGTRNGNGFLCRCPLPQHGRGRGDLRPSLSIADGTEGRLLVTCFAGCDPRQILEWIRGRGFPATIDRHPSRQPGSSQTAEVMTRSAMAIWNESVPASGTLVETYLSFRRIDVEIPKAIRFHPAMRHRPSQTVWPAMIALVTNSRGSPVAVHRTYLAQDGLGKAPADPPKMMLGPCSGGAARLGPADASLMIGEGIESTLAVVKATGRPAWAALSTSGLTGLQLPMTVREVTVLADGDDAGERAARSCANRWADEGRRVLIARPPRGLDFNDMILGRGSVGGSIAL